MATINGIFLSLSSSSSGSLLILTEGVVEWCYAIFGRTKGSILQKLSEDSETSGMTSECDSADMCAGKFPLMLMGGTAWR